MQRPKMLQSYESDFGFSTIGVSRRFDGNNYSDLFGIGKSKGTKADRKAARQEKRGNRKIDKARIKGEKERALLGLSNDDLQAVAGQGAPATAEKSNTVYYIAGALVLVVIIVMVMIKKK